MAHDYTLVTDEQSPLIEGEDSPRDNRSPSPGIQLDEPLVQSKSTGYLVLLTLCIGGLQIVWSVELSNGSPYLLSLGMSKALLAFVWLAGPLTGALVQPYVGIKSDQCRISWGKRKPFMVAGALGTIGASMLLAYAKEIIRLLGGLEYDAPYQGNYKGATIIFATVMMWVLDFAINTVQAATRAFIVDNAPAHQQESANAWASRIVGIGNVLGYIFGYLNLPRLFWFFGDTQFKVLVVIAAIALSTTLMISVSFITERNPQLDPPSKSDNQNGGLFSFFAQVFRSIQRLPPQIRKICEVQFAYWIGWFPFLFYITTYIGQLYVNPDIHPGLSDEEIDQLWAKATRVGTFALLVYAIVSFSSNLLMPFFIVPTYKKPLAVGSSLKRSITPTSPIGTRSRSPSYSEVAFQNATAAQVEAQSIASPARKTGLARLQIPGLTLRRTWFLSQLLFAACMFSTFFISTPTAATVMTAVVGISWSVTLWAPFALISGEIAKRDEARRLRQRRKSITGNDEFEDDDEDKAGVLLGLHNVAISSPQVLATLISSMVFKFLQKPRNVAGDNSVGWTLRIGGVAALGAAFITWRMKEADEADED